MVFSAAQDHIRVFSLMHPVGNEYLPIRDDIRAMAETGRALVVSEKRSLVGTGETESNVTDTYRAWI